MKSSQQRMHHKHSFKCLVTGLGVLLLSTSATSAQYSVRYVGLGPGSIGSGGFSPNFAVVSPGQEITLYAEIKNAQHYLCDSDPHACSQRVTLLWLGPSDKSDISTEKRDWLRWLRKDSSEKYAPVFFKQEISFLTENRVYQTAVTIQDHPRQHRALRGRSKATVTAREDRLQHFGVCIQSPNQAEDCSDDSIEHVSVEVRALALGDLDLGITAGFDSNRRQNLTVRPGSEFWWGWTIENTDRIYFASRILRLEFRASHNDEWITVPRFGLRKLHYYDRRGFEMWDAPSAVGTFGFQFCIDAHDSNSTNDCSQELKLTVK